MPFYHHLGKMPHKRHTTFKKPDGGYYYEQLFGTIGFDGMSSLLYHVHRPTQVKEVIKSYDVSPKIAVDKNMLSLGLKGFAVEPKADFLESRTPVLVNNDCHIVLAAPQKSLRDYFYKNADLQIKIEEFNSSKIYIVGAVRNQKTIKLDQKPIRLIEAAIEANFNPSSQDKIFGTKGFLRRDNEVYKINIANSFSGSDDKENFFLKKNDVIFIDRNSDAIHVFGEVSKPGIYFPNIDYSLTELISTSGLNQLTANAKKVYVIREKFNTFLEVDVFQLDVRNPINLISGRKFMLQAKDIIFVPPTEIVKWNRTISLLLPQTDLFKSYNPIIQEGVKFENSNVTE